MIKDALDFAVKNQEIEIINHKKFKLYKLYEDAMGEYKRYINRPRINSIAIVNNLVNNIDQKTVDQKIDFTFEDCFCSLNSDKGIDKVLVNLNLTYK